MCVNAHPGMLLICLYMQQRLLFSKACAFNCSGVNKRAALPVTELSLGARFLMESHTQICRCSCTVSLSSLVTFIHCDTETSVTSATASLPPLGKE